MQTGKQVRLHRVPNSLQPKLSDPNVQVYSPRILVAAKMSLAATSPRRPDTLMHEALGYKMGSSNHFEGKNERENNHNAVLERETLRKTNFLEFSLGIWRIKAKNPSFI